MTKASKTKVVEKKVKVAVKAIVAKKPDTTTQLLASPANAKVLKKSLDNAKAGKVHTRALDTLKKLIPSVPKEVKQTPPVPARKQTKPTFSRPVKPVAIAVVEQKKPVVPARPHFDFDKEDAVKTTKSDSPFITGINISRVIGTSAKILNVRKSFIVK